MRQFLILLMISCVLPLSAQRNNKWANPVASGYVENFFKVDEGVYRCAQPGADAFAELESAGIREVLNLRNFHDDYKNAKQTQLTLHRVRMRAGNPDREKMVEALQVIKNRKGPIVIHCWHGSDRTGVVIALYRIVFQGWTKGEAIDELENGGYGYHSIFSDIKTFIREVDVEALKKSVME